MNDFQFQTSVRSICSNKNGQTVSSEKVVTIKIFVEQTKALYLCAMRTPIFRQLAMMSLDMGMLQKLIKRGLYKKENITDEFKSLVWNEMGDKKRRKSFLHLAKCLNNQDLMEITEDLRGINFPVLIIRGEGDLYLNSIISQKLHQDIPKSSLVTIKTGGHFIQEDEPDLIVKNILSFYNINSE